MIDVAGVLDGRRVAAAAVAIEGHVRRTPLEESAVFSEMAGSRVFLKLENLQRTGAFKIRGALSRVLGLEPELRAQGVITASAGNHGLGLAHAARLLAAPAWVILPEGVPLAKLTAIQRAGAETVITGADYDEAHEAALRLADEHHATYVHAFDDPDVIAGQGTVALEILQEDMEIDTLVVPVGGGGLLAGSALVTAPRKVRLVGVQAEGAPAFARSFASRRITEASARTIADGIAVRRPAERTLAAALGSADDIVTVSEEAIARAMLLLLEHHKLLSEPAGAAALAAVIGGLVPAGRRIGVVISGGNVDPNLLAKVIQQGLASAGRYLAFRTWLDDRPGALNTLTSILTNARVNILHIGIDRLGPYTSLGRVGLDVIVDTRDAEHASWVLGLVRDRGFPAEELLDTAPRVSSGVSSGHP